jgi:hypothetical protein
MISVLGEIWRNFNWFSVQGTGGSTTGPDPEDRVGDQDVRSPGKPVSSGMQVPGESGHCRIRTRPPCWPSRGSAVFLQNLLQLLKQRWVIFRVEFSPFEDNQWEWTQMIEAITITAGFCTRNCLVAGWGKPLCRHSTDCRFVSGS